MELTIQYWYLLPISVLIATIAMSSGLGGAVFSHHFLFYHCNWNHLLLSAQLWQRSFSVSALGSMHI